MKVRKVSLQGREGEKEGRWKEAMERRAEEQRKGRQQITKRHEEDEKKGGTEGADLCSTCSKAEESTVASPALALVSFGGGTRPTRRR